MQKFVTKKLLFTLSGACLLAGGIIYAAGPQIIIDPTRFVSQERIQRININSTGTNTVKEALVNSGTKKPVLLIGSTSGSDNLGAITRNNTITGDVSSVIGGKGNSNLGDETSLIAGSQDSIVEKNVKSTVILGGKNNTGSAANQVILSSEKTNVSKIDGVAMGLSNSNIDSSYAIGLIGDKITISGGSNSVALGSNINIQTGGMFIFNANGGTVTGNLKDTIFINAEHGLVIGGPKIIPSTVSNSKAVKLTVHGGVALGQGKCSKDTIGGIYYASGTTKTNGKIACICACVASGSTAKSIAVSNQPYCDVACKNTEGAGGNEKIDGSAVCGSRGYPGSGSKISQEHGKEMIYESWETTWRPNSDFCKDGSMPEVGTLESHTPGVVGFPGTGMTVSWVCPGLTDKDPKVQCNAYKKVVPPKCGENAKKYYLNDDSYPVYSEGSFCEIGEFFGISSPSKTYSDYDFPGAGGTTIWGCKTNSGHVDAIENKSCVASRSDCNHCAKNGFPYCFDIDYTTVPGKPGCESNPDETDGNGEGTTDPVEKKYTVKFNCNGGGGSTASQSYNVGETKALNTNTCTHSTKNFGGWATSSAGTKVYDDGAVVNPGGTAGSTVNLYAVWVDKPSCPAPTITSVDGSNINFNLNGASANTVIVFVSQNKSNWSSSGGPATSPRTFSASYSKGYVKLVTVCSNSVSSADSNIVEFGGSSSSSCFFPTMVIDKVENCAIKYHFNGPDPISGKSCCTAARLDRSLDGETGWWPLTTVYGSPLTGSRVGNNGDSGMIYLRYTYSGCNGEFSPVISYNMPVQSGCPGSSSSMKKTFYNGKCLNWKNNGLYDSNGKLITTISGWKRMGNGYDVRYNSYQSPHWVIWYDNDTTTWGSYSDAYLDYYSDFSKILSAGYSFPLTVYHPGTSNQWHKIVLSNTGYTQSVTQYGIGNLYSSTCTN